MIKMTKYFILNNNLVNFLLKLKYLYYYLIYLLNIINQTLKEIYADESKLTVGITLDKNFKNMNNA